MPKHKRLIVSAKVVTAGRKRKCYHVPSHIILKGESCLEVKDKMAVKGYCVVCAEIMIRNALEPLGQLRVTLGGDIAPVDNANLELHDHD